MAVVETDCRVELVGFGFVLFFVCLFMYLFVCSFVKEMIVVFNHDKSVKNCFYPIVPIFVWHVYLQLIET